MRDCHIIIADVTKILLRHATVNNNAFVVVLLRENVAMRCDKRIEFAIRDAQIDIDLDKRYLLYTSPSPRDLSTSRMPSSA